MHPQEFSAANSLHSRAVNGQWGVVTRVSPEVHHNLLCLTHIEGQFAPHHSASCATSSLYCVSSLLLMRPTTDVSSANLMYVIGVELGSAVMGQQREEQRAEHTALWGTSAQCVAANTD